jgi:hypothetical protein
VSDQSDGSIVSDVAANVKLEPRARDVARELRRALRPPFSWLSGFAFNLVLAVAYLLYLLRDKTSLHRLGLAGVFVMGWLLSDVTATNLLGHDPDDARALAERRGSVSEVLTVRVFVLAIIAAPIGLLACVVGEAVTDSWQDLLRDLLLTVAPLSIWVGMGALLSVLIPVRQLTIRERWRARSTWLRWGASCVIPWLLSLVALQFLVAPLVGVDLLHSSVLRTLRLRGIVAIELWGLFLCSLGLWAASWIAERRQQYLLGVVWTPSAIAGTSPVLATAQPLVARCSARRRPVPVTAVVTFGILLLGAGAALLTSRGTDPRSTGTPSRSLGQSPGSVENAAVVGRLARAALVGAETLAAGSSSRVTILRVAASSDPAVSWVPGDVESTSGAVVSALFRTTPDRGIYAMRSPTGLCFFARSSTDGLATLFTVRRGATCAAVDAPATGWVLESRLASLQAP